jgi:hypothetical protein
MPRSVVTGRTIYEDSRITVSTAAITLRGYWLPFGLARTIRVAELAGVTQLSRDDPGFAAWPRWGRRGKGTWFPLDVSRPRRDVAVALSSANGTRVVVTPANPARFVSLLAELGIPGAEAPPAASTD